MNFPNDECCNVKQFQTNYIAQIEAWNGANIDDAKVMQSHGTRGADKTVMTQWQLWKQVTGDEFEFEHINIVQDKGIALGVEYK